MAIGGIGGGLVPGLFGGDGFGQRQGGMGALLPLLLLLLMMVGGGGLGEAGGPGSYGGGPGGPGGCGGGPGGCCGSSRVNPCFGRGGCCGGAGFPGAGLPGGGGFELCLRLRAGVGGFLG